MRKFCYRCMKANCLCDQVVQISNEIEVVILQHSDEMKHPKNTAQLLHLSLTNSKIIRAKKFSDQINKIIKNKRYALVFPDIHHLNASTKWDNKIKPEGIILIDGTWKKAKKIYYETIQLQSLPKIQIANQSNDYQIRKSPHDSALSTFEAAYFALEQLAENKVESIMPLFKTFIKESLERVETMKREKL